MTPSSIEKEPEKIQKICPNCGSTEQHLYIHSKHSHATWSPKVKDKKIFVECPDCKRILELEEDPSFLSKNDDSTISDEEVVEEELAPSTRLRYFSYLGIAFLILLMLWGLMSVLQDDRDVKNYLIHPQANVLFISEIAPDQYQVGIIHRIENGILNLQLESKTYKKFTDAEQHMQQLKDTYQSSTESNQVNILGEEKQLPVNNLSQLNLRRVVSIKN